MNTLYLMFYLEAWLEDLKTVGSTPLPLTSGHNGIIISCIF